MLLGYQQMSLATDVEVQFNHYIMTQSEFQKIIDRNGPVINAIKDKAYGLHASVNQTYDKIHPYGFHLDMVAESVYKYGYLVCADDADVLPLFFGAYYHDSIEDARQTYNDVKRTALEYMDEEKASLATEIVYALTNDKGRTREERAGERYYQGIRTTAYAPFVKLADRLANISYSFRSKANPANEHMRNVYLKELPHFLNAIDAQNEDKRFSLPQVMVTKIQDIVSG